jgi:hypothetical protein
MIISLQKALFSNKNIDFAEECSIFDQKLSFRSRSNVAGVSRAQAAAHLQSMEEVKKEKRKKTFILDFLDACKDTL